MPKNGRPTGILVIGKRAENRVRALILRVLAVTRTQQKNALVTLKKSCVADPGIGLQTVRRLGRDDLIFRRISHIITLDFDAQPRWMKQECFRAHLKIAKGDPVRIGAITLSGVSGSGGDSVLKESSGI